MDQEKLYTEGLISIGIKIQKNTDVKQLLFKKSIKRTNIINNLVRFLNKHSSEDYTDTDICKIMKQFIYAPDGALEKFVAGQLVDKTEEKRIWDAIFRNIACMKIQKNDSNELEKDCYEYLKTTILSSTFPVHLANKIVTHTPDTVDIVEQENENCDGDKIDSDTNLSLSSILENGLNENELSNCNNDQDIKIFRQVSASLEEIEKQIKLIMQ